MLTIRYAAATDTGRLRDLNEDAWLTDERHGLFVVADGMGGHQAGEVASALALEAFSSALRESLGATSQEIRQSLKQAIAAANAAVADASRRNEKYAGMGTTLTAAVITGRTLYLSHIGDSRAYLVRDDGMTQLTEDHTLLHEMVARGEVEPEEARFHPLRNVITRALGTFSTVQADIAIHELQAGDQILLCTDGLTSMVEDDRVVAAVREEKDLEAVANRLIREANEAGGEDNITIVLIAV